MATDREKQSARKSATRVGQVVFQPLLASSTGATLPVAFATLPWSYQGTLGLSVIVKASFSLDDGKMRPRKAEPIYQRDTARDNGALMAAPSDLVPRRPLVDVLAVGRAQAAPGRSASRIAVRLALMQGGLVRIDRSAELAANEIAPFGPVAATETARRALLAAAPALDQQGVLHVPGNLQWAYYQCAPAGQTVDGLRGDALLVLEGMNAQRPAIRSELPGCWAVGSIFGLAHAQPDRGLELAFKPDTVVADAERLVCSVVWRAEVRLTDVAQLPALTVAAGVAIREFPLKAPLSLAALRRHETEPPAGLGATVAFGGDVAAVALAGAAKPAPATSFADSELAQGTAALSLEQLTKEALPFDPNASAKRPAALAWAEKHGADAKGGTVSSSGTPAAAGAPHPFAKRPAAGKAAQAAAWADAIAKTPAAKPKQKPASRRRPPPPKRGASPSRPADPHDDIEPISILPDSAVLADSAILPDSAVSADSAILPDSVVSSVQPAVDAARMAHVASSFKSVDATAAPQSAPIKAAPLPFSPAAEGVPLPSAERWAKLTQLPSKGQTAPGTIGASRPAPLPFEENKRQAQIEQARLERERRHAEELAAAAEQAALQAEAEREQAAAAEEQRKQDEQLAAQRAVEEKQRFEESQRRLREQEAKRAEEARVKAKKEAEELEDGLYGGFGS